MRDGDYEHRGVVVSGIEWENMPYQALRVCACGRKIARISHSDICQRCIDREYEEKLSRRFASTGKRVGNAKVQRRDAFACAGVQRTHAG